jgi:hypothetical protein
VGTYCFTLGSGVISYASRKQKTVAASLTDAEYIAVSEASREVCWLRQLLDEIGYSQDSPTPLLCDNNGAISLSGDPSFHSRVKHLDIQYHFIREKVEDDIIIVNRVPSHENLTDLLTKPLGKTKFQKFHSQLGLHN